MIEDLAEPRIIFDSPVGVFFAFTAVRPRGCTCVAYLGYKLTDELWAATQKGDDVTMREALSGGDALSEALSVGTYGCAAHNADGAVEKFLADLRDGAERRDPLRDSLPLADVVDELMERHLGPVV